MINSLLMRCKIRNKWEVKKDSWIMDKRILNTYNRHMIEMAPNKALDVIDNKRNLLLLWRLNDVVKDIRIHVLITLKSRWKGRTMPHRVNQGHRDPAKLTAPRGFLLDRKSPKHCYENNGWSPLNSKEGPSPYPPLRSFTGSTTYLFSSK